uniref:Uncharacterized protein n=1 Tax=Parascaris equorum TaxID=6256 RepID=A0A914RZX8_PAREQ
MVEWVVTRIISSQNIHANKFVQVFSALLIASH